MPKYTVSVKWGKEKLAAELTSEESPDVFKLQIYSLTNVLPERQKVMLKGKVLKDTWEGFRLKNGLTFLLLGSAEALPAAPVTPTKFLEDMNEDELNSAMDINTGLENLGNTCYMNATIQMLSTVPEFSNALQSLPTNHFAAALSDMTSGGINNTDTLGKKITAELGNIMKILSSKEKVSFKPLFFLQYIYSRFPQFAEKNEHGTPMQQDANEFLSELLRLCQENLPVDNGGGTTTKSSFVEQYFGIEYENTLKCIDEEGTSEEATYSKESAIQLNCFISQEIKFLLNGVKSKLNEEVTKNSPSLNRNAKYLKTSKISRLPAYLCVQMVRFFYKEKGNVNAKILKDVKFPMKLDTYDLCTPDLQKRLKPVRERFASQDEAESEAAIALKQQHKGDKVAMKKAAAKTGKKGAAHKESDYEPYHFSSDIGSSNSGHYELQSIITHQGRSSSSGHYVAWLRVEGDNWVKCDDEEMTPVSADEVKKLSGGGDWHIAYLLLYGPRRMDKYQAEVAVEAIKVAAQSTAMES